MIAARAMTRVHAIALAFALAAMLTAAATARAASPARIIALLNAQRTANGIPAGIVENANWSADCEAHDHWEQLNHVFGHSETPGTPGYTAGGLLAAENSVLTEGIYWTHSDPYDTAPFHLFQLLAPRLAVAGAADAYDHDCVTTLLGDTRAAPASSVAYSYPGNGRTGVAPSEFADELPTTPAAELGLGNRVTGPNLFVYFDGPWANGAPAQVTAATLTGTQGVVAIRYLDNTTAGGLPGIYPTGAILVPVKPLRPGTKYQVAVTATISGLMPENPPPASGYECETFGSGPEVCGQMQTWTVSESFSFTTAHRRRRHKR